MKKNIVSLLAFLLVCNFSYAQTPSPEQIIDNYLKAIGGRDAIAKIQDISSTMTGNVQGMTIEVSSQKKSLNKILMTVSVKEMGEMQKLQSDGTKIKMINQGNPVDLDDKQLKAVVLTQISLFPEVNYTASGVLMKVVGIEKIEGKDTYKIEASLDENKWTDYYDVASGLKVKQETSAETPAGTAKIAIAYSDYKEVAGIKFPHKINQDMGAFQIEMTANKVEVNKNLADSLFEIKW